MVFQQRTHPDGRAKPHTKTPPTAELSSENLAPQSNSEVPRISVEEHKKRLDSGEEILVADTRSEATFGYDHVAGALSFPENEVESRLSELPSGRDIVFYFS